MGYDSEKIIMELDLRRSTQDAKELTQALDQLDAKVAETAKTYEVLERATKDYTVVVGQNDAALDREVAALVDATRAAKFYNEVFEEMGQQAAFVVPNIEHAGAAMDSLKGSGGAGGMGILGVSYAVQDFTSVMQSGGGFSRALGSIQNNITPILTGLGMTAGLAGAVSLVSVAVGAAIPLLTTFGEKEKDVAKAADEATKAMENQRKAADALAGRPSPSQAETAAGVTEYLGLVGGENIRLGIEGAVQAGRPGIGLSAEERKQLAALEHAGIGRGGRGDAMFPGLAAERRALLAKSAQAAKDEADRLLLALPTDRAARETVRQMARARPGLFPGIPGLADDLQSFEAEDQAQANARMMVAEEEGAAPHEAGVKRRAAAKEYNERRRRMEANLEKATRMGVDALDNEEHERGKAAKARDQALRAIPGQINRGEKLLEQGRAMMRQQEVEREINRRSGGQDAYKDIQEAARRTLDLTARGVHINDAIMTAMREQGAKIDALNQHITGQDEMIRQLRQQNRQRRPAGMRRAFPQ